MHKMRTKHTTAPIFNSSLRFRARISVCRVISITLLSSSRLMLPSLSVSALSSMARTFLSKRTNCAPLRLMPPPLSLTTLPGSKATGGVAWAIAAPVHVAPNRCQHGCISRTTGEVERALWHLQTPGASAFCGDGAVGGPRVQPRLECQRLPDALPSLGALLRRTSRHGPWRVWQDVSMATTPKLPKPSFHQAELCPPKNEFVLNESRSACALLPCIVAGAKSHFM